MASPPDGSDIRRKLVDFVMEELDTSRTPDPVDGNGELRLRRQEIDRALASALAKLDPLDQVLLKLRFEDGMKARDIAQVLKFPTAFHVYRRVQSRLKTLRALLTEGGIDGPRP